MQKFLLIEGSGESANVIRVFFFSKSYQNNKFDTCECYSCQMKLIVTFVHLYVFWLSKATSYKSINLHLIVRVFWVLQKENLVLIQYGGGVAVVYHKKTNDFTEL